MTGPGSLQQTLFLEASCIITVTGIVVFGILLLICAVKNHFCGILQPVLDLAVAVFPGCWGPIVSTAWWPRSIGIILCIGDPWGLKAISHLPLVIVFCLLLVSWASTGWMYLVTASLGHLLTKDCVPMPPPWPTLRLRQLCKPDPLFSHMACHQHPTLLSLAFIATTAWLCRA